MDRETMLKSLKAAISDVLETMFFQSVEIQERNSVINSWFEDDLPLLGASLDFHGPCDGVFYLVSPVEAIAEFTANFLGIENPGVSDAQKEDTLKEAVNMIAGHMFSLFDKEGAYRLEIPVLMEQPTLGDPGDTGSGTSHLLIRTDGSRLAAGLRVSP